MLRVHGKLRRSRANGPGLRAVIWAQGCDLACPGCYNPESHAAGGGEAAPVAELIDWVLAGAGAIEGLTISGGEPLQQAEPVLALLRGVRQKSQLSTLLFSGYRLEEIERQPLGPAILAELDVLIDGRYVQTRHRGAGLQGSENQRIHCLTGRYTPDQVRATPATEVHIAADGTVHLTGVSPLEPAE